MNNKMNKETHSMQTLLEFDELLYNLDNEEDPIKEKQLLKEIDAYKERWNL